MRPVDQQTLAAIGGQKATQAASALSRTVLNTASMVADMQNKRDTLELANAKHKIDTEATGLTMAQQRLEIMGRAGIGIQEMAQTHTDPTAFMSAYNDNYEDLPKEVRQMMPDPAQSSYEDITEWSVQAAQQSEQGVAYLKAQSSGASMQKYQYIQAMMNKRVEGTITQGEEQFLTYVESEFGISPSTSDQKEATFLDVRELGFKVDGQNIFEGFGDTQLYALSGNITDRVKTMEAINKRYNVQESADVLRRKAIQGMIDDGNLVRRESLTDEAINWISKKLGGEGGSGTWVYDPTPGETAQYEQAQGNTDQEALIALPIGKTYKASDGTTYKKVSETEVEIVE
jgi:hypothetical protein